jgi:EF-P beta-lysylation protein EpmB
MIPVSSTTLDSNSEIKVVSASDSWQKQLASAFKTPKALFEYLNLREEALPYSLDNQATFRTRVTQHFADLMTPSNPFDPLLLQVLPLSEETEEVAGFVEDPLEEDQFSVLPGLIHKYKNRALVIAHQACAIHCRYCFRRHFPYSEARLSQQAVDDICDYLDSHSDINEVILSGGDPLSLSDQALVDLLMRFDGLKHIDTLRIHTRTPVVLPDRITDDLLKGLNSLRGNVVMVLHINHSQEISPAIIEKAKRLKQNDVTLLNQTVLLRGINDNADVLCNLSKQLFQSGITPYYLHLLDPVQGAHHFKIEDSKAQEIWITMQNTLSGYLLPRLVRESPNQASKTWKNPLR